MSVRRPAGRLSNSVPCVLSLSADGHNSLGAPGSEFMFSFEDGWADFVANWFHGDSEALTVIYDMNKLISRPFNMKNNFVSCNLKQVSYFV